MCLITLVASCRKADVARFPGYTIRSSGTARPFLLNENMVHASGALEDRKISFTAISPQPSYYKMINAIADCEGKIDGGDGATYRPNGEFLHALDRQDIVADPDLTIVAQQACSLIRPANLGKTLQTDSAMRSVFGNFAPADKTASANLKYGSDWKESKVTFLSQAAFDDKGRDVVAVMTGSSPLGEDCHACGSRIDVYTFFRPAGGDWVFGSADRNVTTAGQFGSPPDVKIVHLSPTAPGFELDTASMHQGVTDSNAQLIARLGEHFVTVASLELEGDNSGSCGNDQPLPDPCYTYASKINILPVVSSGLYDFDLQKSGTDQDGNTAALKDVSGITHYRFDGKEYRASLK